MLWLPPLVYMILIFHWSSESRPMPVVSAHVWDKLLHFIEYGGLGALFCRALWGEGLGWAAALVVAAVALDGVNRSNIASDLRPGQSCIG